MKVMVSEDGTLKVRNEVNDDVSCSVMEAAARLQDEVKGYHKYTRMGETYTEEANQEFHHALRAMKDLIMCFYEMPKSDEQQHLFINHLAEAVKCIDPAQVEAAAHAHA